MSKEIATTEEKKPDSFLSQVMALATNPNFNKENLQALMEMNERIIERDNKAQFAASYVEMKPYLPKVLKTHRNNQTNSNYAKLEDVNEAVDVILEKYGFATATKVTNQNDTSVTVEAELWHRSGHVERTSVTIPLDNKGMAGSVNKTLPHATSSSITYGKRIAICALLNISTGDDVDGNGRNKVGSSPKSPPITEEQEMELDILIAVTDTDKAKFFLAYKVNALQDLNQEQYTKAMGQLKKKDKQIREGK